MPVDAQKILETAEDGGLSHPYLLLLELTRAGVPRVQGRHVLRMNGYPIPLGTPDGAIDPRVEAQSRKRCRAGFAGEVGFAG